MALPSRRIRTRRMLAGVIVATAALGASAAPAFAGNEPNVIAQATGAFVNGRVTTDVTCTAKANQSAAQVTVIERCYTTNGVYAPGNTGFGPVAQTETVGTVDEILGMQICAVAYSLNSFGVKSDVFSGCQDVNPVTGTALLVH